MITRESIRSVLQSEVGRETVVFGWVRTARASRNVAFAAINDGSCAENLQVVFDRERFSDDRLSGLLTGACVRAAGAVVQSPGQGQVMELHASTLEIVGSVDDAYPLQKKRHSLEFLRSMTHLRPRTNTFANVFRMRHHLCLAIHRFFDEEGFFYIQPPLITSSDAEGAGETFQVTSMPLTAVPMSEGRVDFSHDFFRAPAFLSVSAQLEAEPLALALGKVYTFGPTFRADPSDTRTHAAEFWMIEPEMAFFDLEDNMNLIERFMKYCARYVAERCAHEVEFFQTHYEPRLGERYRTIVENEFGRITYKEALKSLSEAGANLETVPVWGDDFTSEHQRHLAGNVFGRPVFVTDFPACIKPFYMRVNDDGETVAGVDLFAPVVGELVGGSQREERLEHLERRARQAGMNLETYRWYLELRRWGTAPHSGFGLGFDRLLMYLTGMENIRDVIPYPRAFGKMY
ncbi:MAG: asparagine--tRNA ligase [Candidatus Eisenbacteria bacterium]|nr:asparagine--tRNA ligase [Candidatus Eisenbacteria bacterium]